ncbi:Uu.00g033640.m01.CDS01 [Anthostomella pinea]|uniref:Uu.00g033640.m01.CDS01 n=1 Tax=Anthostomella pinea TaxID=933095 RepID=A0AAI8V8W6_9PEZI|nr:Uu.00g033640.m01.CDS01 [Anthostomella pinea]
MSFLPSSLDKECDRAARILKSFTGVSGTPTSAGKGKAKIPTTVIANAKGLAIFTGFRAGMWLSGAGGSGIVVARLPDGTWSPPSGFTVRSGGMGIVFGVDVYDCVCVLNTPAAVEAYTRPRLAIGSEVTAAAGPLNAKMDAVSDVKPVWTYTKSRGIWGGVTLDGTAISVRPDANAEFYGEPKISIERILRGDVPAAAPAAAAGKTKVVMWPAGAKKLTEVLKASEGKVADVSVMGALGDEPTAGDLGVVPDS